MKIYQDYDSKNISKAWESYLKLSNSYEHHCESYEDFAKIKKLTRVWKKIFNSANIPQSATCLEIGCGGGINLARLALNDFTVHGIDISSDVISRAESFLNEVKKFQDINATVEVSDIFTYESSNLYDVCFHFGVVEHFLNDLDRERFWKKAYSLTKSGGWIVSVVPCGQHLMRKLVKENCLAGYNIPEIDYSCELHQKELECIGLTPIYTIPHNYFSFLSAHPSKVISKVLYPFLFVSGNLLIPKLPLKNSIKEKWAHSLIVIGKK